MGDNGAQGSDGGRAWHAGWLAGAAGLTAVGTIAGISVARSMTRRSLAEDPYDGEDFEAVDSARSHVVTTPDGVSLAAREVGPVDAPLTVVFAHGFCLNMSAFHFQRMRLAHEWGSQVRMVFYDQRGHGRSGEGSPQSYTVTQLGMDLQTVLAVLAPRGAIVLVGHSMGGMTVLSHAREYPHHYGGRIVGAALISSAAEGVSRSLLGEVLKNPALEAVRLTARSAPKLVHHSRVAARSLIGPILAAASYGDMKTSPSVVAFSQKMMYGTPIPTMVEFLRALETYDESAALPILAKIPTLIACGDNDLVTPSDYSREMAAALPKAELLIVGGAGHLVQLEKPETVNDGLVRLIRRAAPGRMAALTRRLRERARRRA